MTPKTLKLKKLAAALNVTEDELLNGPIAIGKPLILSPAFPLLHTVRAAFTAYGVPLLAITFKSKSVYLFDKLFQFKQFPRIQQVYEDC